jgi:4'-phosphopantetheinyl transferase
VRRERILNPVIRPTPGRGERLSARERVLNRRLGARMALHDSASMSSAELGPLEKDGRDAPLPSNGWHWSITHCSEVVAGVVFRSPVGLDVQRVEVRKPDLIPPVTSHDELVLFGGFSWRAFTRAWSAKEAVLKLLGVGIGELSQSHIVAVPDDASLVLTHGNRTYYVHQKTFEQARDVFVAAVCADVKGDVELSWIVDATPCGSVASSAAPLHSGRRAEGTGPA